MVFQRKVVKPQIRKYFIMIIFLGVVRVFATDNLSKTDVISSKTKIATPSGPLTLRLDVWQQTIHLFHAKTKKRIQSIVFGGEHMVLSPEFFLEHPWEKIKFRDLNFDGVPDILIPYNNSVSDVWYMVYLYDRKRNQFIFHPEFMDEANWDADATKRLLSSGRSGGMAGRIFEAKTYRWRKSKLYLMKKVIQTCAETPPDCRLMERSTYVRDSRGGFFRKKARTILSHLSEAECS